jgi:hypothetical protein
MQAVITLFPLLILLLFDAALSIDQKLPVLFSRTYVNEAAGYYHKGWLIDSSGAIRNFSFSLSDSMRNVWLSDPPMSFCDHPPSTFQCPDKISWRKLPVNYCRKMISLSKATDRKVSRETLAAMQTLIAPASTGVLAYGGACADYGEYIYTAYMPDSVDSLCHQIVCYHFGDMWTCNASPEAKNIARWLISLDSAYGKSCPAPDSCLKPVTAVIPQTCNRSAVFKSSTGDRFYLNGKKAIYLQRKVTVSDGMKQKVNMK